MRCCGIVAAILFFVAVAFKLNGSSVGMWRELLTEPGPPRGLIFSTPKRIRVDEWGVWTPSALSQARQQPAFPVENSNLGAGRAPLVMNVPVAYYTTFFRPQFWGFFVFGFVRGFSFYWCAKFFGLLLAAGWALRQLGVRSRLIVVFGAVWVLFTSYVQWWFSSPAMLPEMLASWFMCLGCSVTFFKDRHWGRTTLALIVFVFFGINFVLCLYPPYQAPLMLLFFTMLAGIWRESRHKSEPASSKRAFLLVSIGLVGVGLILVPFWLDVRSTLEMVAHTVYPGARRSIGGELSFFKLFSGVLGFFESEQSVPAVYDNISEASNFYPLWPSAALIVFAAWYRDKVRPAPVFVMLSIFLAGLSVYCVSPLPTWLLRITLLNFATEPRSLLALGVANIFFCCLFLDRFRAAVFSRIGSVIAILTLWLGVVLLLWFARSHNAAYFADPWHWITALAVSALILFLLFWDRLRYRWLPIALGLLLVASNFPINPIMRGLSPLVDSVAVKTIDRVRAGDPDGKWIIYHTRYFAQLVKATGGNVFNGTKTVPDLSFLHQLDPERAYEQVYNRYANVGCEVPRLSHESSASLVYFDYYIWFLPPDLPALIDAGYRYILIPKEWPEAANYGFALVEKISPGDLWIYRREK